MRAAADDNDTTRLGLRRTGRVSLHRRIGARPCAEAGKQLSPIVFNSIRSRSVRGRSLRPAAHGRGMGRAMSSVGDTGSGAGAHVRSEPHSIRGFAVRSHRRAALALALLAVPGPL